MGEQGAGSEEIMGNVFEVHNLVAGKPIATNSIFEKFSPVDGRLVARVHAADADIVDQAVKAGQHALENSWGVMPVQKRAEVLRKIAGLIASHADEITAADCAETGRPEGLSRFLNTDRSAYLLRMAAEEAVTWFGESYHFNAPDGGRVLNYTNRHPRGVVGIFGPWNMPLLLTLMNVAPALAAGNSVIVKPSEESPITASIFAEIAHEAGLPEGALSVLQGFGPGATGEFMTSHPGIAAYALIGESSTGTAIMKNAAVGLRPVNFELGGKNPSIICADADLKKAVPGTVASCFTNSGQVCFNTERVYVHEDLFDGFMEKFTAATASMKLGDPNDPEVKQGPLISRHHREKVITAVDRALAEGAKCWTGGAVPEFGNDFDKGAYYSPTILSGLADDSDIMTNEVFGPVCHVTTFTEIDEVVARANNTAYGLSSSIWTQNVDTAHQLSARIRAGVNWVNCWQMRDPRTPLAGFGMSGVGTGGGRAALEFFSQQGIVTLKY